MLLKKESRFKNTLKSIWPFRQTRKSSEEFEHVHLPDEFQVLLKPTILLLSKELGSFSQTHQFVIEAFKAADENFKKSQYRNALSELDIIDERHQYLSVLLAQGVALMLVSEPKKAAEILDQGLRLSQHKQSNQFEAAFGINLGQAYSDMGEPNRASEILNNTLQICKKMRDCMLEALVLRHQSMVLLIQAEYHKAVECSEQAIQISDSIGDVAGLGYALCNKGLCLMSQGNLIAATEAFQKSLNTIQKTPLRNHDILGSIYTNLALFYLLQNKIQEATPILEHTLKLYQNAHYNHGEAKNLSMLAANKIVQEDIEEGESLFKRSITLYHRLDYKVGEIKAMLILGHAYLKINHVQNANRLFQLGCNQSKDFGLKRLELETALFLILTDTDLQAHAKISELKNIAARSRSNNFPILEIQALNQIGIQQTNIGLFDDATHSCQLAIDKSQAIQNAIQEAKSRVILSFVQEQMGHHNLAQETLGLAQAFFQSQEISWSFVQIT